MNLQMKQASVYIVLFLFGISIASVASFDQSEIIQELNKRLDRMEAVNSLLVDTLQQFEKRETEHIKELEELRNEIESLKAQTKNQNGDNEEPTRMFGNKTYTDIIDTKRHAGTTGVAFWATISQDMLHMTKFQNIQFEKVITNVGNAYNAASGEFTAPQSGIYVFSTTLLAYPLQSDHFRLVKNGQQLVLMFVSQHSTDTAAGTFVLQLNQGDRVAIQNMDRDRAVSGDDFSFFSGFLLKAM